MEIFPCEAQTTTTLVHGLYTRYEILSETEENNLYTCLLKCRVNQQVRKITAVLANALLDQMFTRILRVPRKYSRNFDLNHIKAWIWNNWKNTLYRNCNCIYGGVQGTCGNPPSDPLEFSHNTQSWQCWHFCTSSNENKFQAVTSGINLNVN